MKDFPCTQCSQCCKNVGNILNSKVQIDPLRRFLLDKFPYKALEDGSCEKLTEDGLCSVYEDRPIICNIKLMSKFYQGSTEEYYDITAKLCNLLIKEAKLDEKYLIKDL